MGVCRQIIVIRKIKNSCMVEYAARHEFDVLVCKNMKRIEKRRRMGGGKNQKKRGKDTAINNFQK